MALLSLPLPLCAPSTPAVASSSRAELSTCWSSTLAGAGKQPPIQKEVRSPLSSTSVQPSIFPRERSVLTLALAQNPPGGSRTSRSSSSVSTSNGDDRSSSGASYAQDGSWRESGNGVAPGAAPQQEQQQSGVAEVTAMRQGIFNNIAPVYDLLNDVLSLGLHRVWKRMTVGWSGARAGDSVLDICCGSGDISFLLAETVGREGKVTGLDFAKEQLAVARDRQRSSFSASRQDMDWVLGNALDLPFSDSSFDAVTMGYGLRNVADIPKALSEIRRVLRPGKKAAILDFNHSEDPLVTNFQGFMLGNVVVPFATQFGVASEYEYLQPSIQRFLTGNTQRRLALDVGFASAVHYEIGGGLMGVLVLEK